MCLSAFAVGTVIVRLLKKYFRFRLLQILLQRSALDFVSYKASWLGINLCVIFMRICEIYFEIIVFTIIIKEHLFL